MLRITDQIVIEDSELSLSFIRASGPGGQNVNKVATAVQLRFDAKASPAICDAMLVRLRAVAGRRMTADGVVVLTADRYRTQEANRRDALARLTDLVRRAATPPRRRVATKPSRAQKERRLKAKKTVGLRKSLRARVSRDD